MNNKIFKLSERQFKRVLGHILTTRFETDGCDCGELNYNIDKLHYIHIYRGCRKSNGTPTDKYFVIDTPVIYKKSTNSNEDDKHTGESYYLPKEQENIITSLCKLRSAYDIEVTEERERFEDTECHEYVVDLIGQIMN